MKKNSKLIAGLVILVAAIVFLIYWFNSRPQLKFNYTYDATKEVLDSSNTGDSAWYLPFEKQYVDFYNAQSRFVKSYFDPQTFSGLIPSKSKFRVSFLPDFELSEEKEYYLYISSGGIGAEGHAFLGFVTMDHNKFSVDGAYGMFSNNSGKDYSTSFFEYNNISKEQQDSLLRIYDSWKPKPVRDSLAFQLLTPAELTKRRHYNTLYFGVVPPEVVKKALASSGNSFFLELTAEEYEYRLFMTQQSIGTAVKQVTREYLLNDFQKEWRKLLLSNLFTLRTARYPLADIPIDISTHPDQNNNEQVPFPHLQLQELLSVEQFSSKFVTTEDQIWKQMVALHKKRNGHKNGFTVSGKSAKIITPIDKDTALLLFDTSLVFNVDQFHAKGLLGLKLIPVAYKGPVSDAGANGVGRLYFSVDSLGKDWHNYPYFTLITTFKNGLPDGSFQFFRSQFGIDDADLVATGACLDGKLTGKLTRYDWRKNISEGSYKNGSIDLNTRFLYHDYDYLNLPHHIPIKNSDFYGIKSSGELLGLNIRSDTAYSQEGVNYFVFDDLFCIQDATQTIYIPCIKNYKTGVLEGTGAVNIFVCKRRKIDLQL